MVSLVWSWYTAFIQCTIWLIHTQGAQIIKSMLPGETCTWSRFHSRTAASRHHIAHCHMSWCPHWLRTDICNAREEGCCAMFLSPSSALVHTPRALCWQCQNACPRPDYQSRGLLQQYPVQCCSSSSSTFSVSSERCCASRHEKVEVRQHHINCMWWSSLAACASTNWLQTVSLRLEMPAPVGSAVPVINDCFPTGSFNTCLLYTSPSPRD